MPRGRLEKTPFWTERGGGGGRSSSPPPASPEPFPLLLPSAGRTGSGSCCPPAWLSPPADPLLLQGARERPTATRSQAPSPSPSLPTPAPSSSGHPAAGPLSLCCLPWALRLSAKPPGLGKTLPPPWTLDAGQAPLPVTALGAPRDWFCPWPYLRLGSRPPLGHPSTSHQLGRRAGVPGHRLSWSGWGCHQLPKAAGGHWPWAAVSQGLSRFCAVQAGLVAPWRFRARRAETGSQAPLATRHQLQAQRSV